MESRKTNLSLQGSDKAAEILSEIGVSTWFANPGTTELHLLSALANNKETKVVLCPFEGVATGAADGYGRMTNRLAGCLLHLGVGFAYGWPNLHNAFRAHSPVLVIVGDHSDSHLSHNPPLASDIIALARAFGLWVRRVSAPSDIARDIQDAIIATYGPPKTPSVLIVPTNVAWGRFSNQRKLTPMKMLDLQKVASEKLEEISMVISKGKRVALVVGGSALQSQNTQIAIAKIAKKFGAQVYLQTANARVDRGEGYIAFDRIPHDVAQAQTLLQEFSDIILIEANSPVAFFQRPDRPSSLSSPRTSVHSLVEPGEDSVEALEQLIQLLGASEVSVEREKAARHKIPSSSFNANAVAAVVAAMLPADSIIVDESISEGRQFPAIIQGVPPHSWLQLTGGSLGFGIPVAIGASMARPGQRIIVFQADGSALYTLQGLWTLAREKLPVTIIILSNRSYALLKRQLLTLNLPTADKTLNHVLELDHPAINWTAIAKGFGVESSRAESTRQFAEAMHTALHHNGPFLIEANLSS